MANKELLGSITKIDWNAEKDTEGRELIFRLETIMNTLCEEGNRLRETSDRLLEGLKTEEETEDMDYTLDHISSNLACAVEMLDEVRFKLFP